MKNPLTSKERRGLVAVAAAALLCIASGFIFRNCSHPKTNDRLIIINDERDSLESRSGGDHDVNGPDIKVHKEKKGKSSKKSSKKKKAEKVYPTRSPLDEPCD